MVQNETAASITEMVAGRFARGCPEHVVTGVADVRLAKASELSFVRGERFATLGEQSKAGVLLVQRLIDSAATQIIVDDPHQAFARVAHHFHPEPRVTEHSVHPTACVDPKAKLIAPVMIGPHVVIGPDTRIDAGTSVRAGAVIGAEVTIGRGCLIYPRVVIYDGVTMGDRCTIHAGAILGSDGFGYVTGAGCVRSKFPQLGALILEDEVEIGANSTLDRGALTSNRIGKGVKIDNLCHVGHNCQIGEHTSISALSAFSADTRIGARCTFGGNVRSGGGVDVCDDVALGGGAVLVKDVTEPGVYAGWPLQPRVSAARTRVLIGRLAKMAEEIRELKRLAARIEGSEASDQS